MTKAPKQSTVYICIVLAILGLILWLMPVIGLSFGIGSALNVLGFLLLFFAWILLTVACYAKAF